MRSLLRFLTDTQTPSAKTTLAFCSISAEKVLERKGGQLPTTLGARTAHIWDLGRSPHSAVTMVLSHQDSGEIYSATLGSATRNALLLSLVLAAHSGSRGLALFSGFRVWWKRALAKPAVTWGPLLPRQLVNVCSLPEASPRQW